MAQYAGYASILFKTLFQLIICSLISLEFQQTKLTMANQTVEMYQQNPATNNSTLISSTSAKHHNLPDCINVTIHKKYFENTTRNGELIITLGYYIGTTQLNRASPGGDFVNLCFPLSPQVLNCELMKTAQAQYVIHENQTLTINGTYSAELGDYYVDEAGLSYSCEQEIRANKKLPRCIYVKMNPDGYSTVENRVFINATQTFINRPQWHHEDDHRTSICYPLSVDFLNCKLSSLYAINSHNYEMQSDMTIPYVPHNIVYFLGDFYKYKNGDILVCMPSKVSEDAVLLFSIVVPIYITSSICLLLALIYQSIVPKRNAYSKCLIGHYLSMFVYYVATTFSYMTLGVQFNEEISRTACFIAISVFYIISTSAMAWLMAAAFDVWNSFSNSNISNAGCGWSFRVKRSNVFVYYNIFVWTVSVLLCILVNIMMIIHNNDNDVDMGCIWKDFYVESIPHFGFVMATCITNSVFYFLTLSIIRGGSKGTELVNKHRKKELFIISGRLFFIMGMHWLVELMAWITRNQVYFVYTNIASMIISLQGVASLVEILCRKGAVTDICKSVKRLRTKLSATGSLDIVC